MSSFSLHVRNLRVLQTVDWAPPPVSAIVGANGAGKTTLILCLKFLRAAFDRGPAVALTQILDGAYDLRNRLAGENDPIELGLDIGSLRWRLRLGTAGSASGAAVEELLYDGEATVFELGPASWVY